MSAVRVAGCHQSVFLAEKCRNCAAVIVFVRVDRFARGGLARIAAKIMNDRDGVRGSLANQFEVTR
jgi:hypothetical protein